MVNNKSLQPTNSVPYKDASAGGGKLPNTASTELPYAEQTNIAVSPTPLADVTLEVAGSPERVESLRRPSVTERVLKIARSWKAKAFEKSRMRSLGEDQEKV